MKAVNLLPEKHRPRKPSTGESRIGYVALGVLGALLVAVLVYVLTLNSINDSKTKTAEATAEAQRLDAEANSLGPYGDFAKIKTERVAAVKQLAEGRFDWERLVRELAQVLPSGVWLTTATASATPADPATAAAAPGAVVAPAGPTLTVAGCARDQSQVAVTLVRLRELQGATDVSLDNSTRGTESVGSQAAAPAPGQSGGAADTSCGSTKGQPNYSFQANVTFVPTPAGSEPGSVPARLGGGS